MFCCRRSLDPVPTEGFAQWTTRWLLVLLLKTESLGRWGLYSTIIDLRYTMHIAYVYSWKQNVYSWKQKKKISERLIYKQKKDIRKTDIKRKEKQRLMQPLSIEPVTSLDKCRVAFLIERAQPITSQEIWPMRWQDPVSNQKPGKRTNQNRGDFFYVRVPTIYL